MANESGHAPGRAYTDQNGHLNLNGSDLLGDTSTATVETLYVTGASTLDDTLTLGLPASSDAYGIRSGSLVLESETSFPVAGSTARSTWRSDNFGYQYLTIDYVSPDAAVTPSFPGITLLGAADDSAGFIEFSGYIPGHQGDLTAIDSAHALLLYWTKGYYAGGLDVGWLYLGDVSSVLTMTSNGNAGIGPNASFAAPQATWHVLGDGLYDGNLTVSGSTVSMANLPTSDPHVAGQLWNSTGTVKVSAGA